MSVSQNNNQINHYYNVLYTALLRDLGFFFGEQKILYPIMKIENPIWNGQKNSLKKI